MVQFSPSAARDFEGRWHVTRRITPQNGPVVRFEGQAVWAPASGGMNYNETGRMVVEGQPPMQAERRYFWADDLSIYFDDGRFFHTVPMTGGVATHRCDPDQYEGRYDFSLWPAFHVIWQVKGPKKDYCSETQYSRL